MKLDLVAGFYRNEELSNADLFIKVGSASEHTQEPGSVQEGALQGSSQTEQCLAQFPAHRLVLFAADYFKAQVSLSLTFQGRCAHLSLHHCNDQ
jgi:hypothetical protein